MERLEEAAKEWLEAHKKDYKCSTVKRRDMSDNVLNFTVSSEDKTTSFIVTCPDTDDGLWSVWSEDETLQRHLDAILEYCDSQRKKTISEILDKMNSVLPLVLSVKAKFEEGDMEIDEEEDDDYEDDDYYNYNDDVDDAQVETRPKIPEGDDSDSEDDRFFGGKTNPAAFQRLVKDLKNMKKEAHKFGIEGLPRGDNLFVWDVKLTGFPADTSLGKDLHSWAEKHKREPVVYLEMQFPSEYPMAPPFVRVTRPRFKFLTGHVTIGGSICMEMLTRSGWMPTNDIEKMKPMDHPHSRVNKVVGLKMEDKCLVLVLARNDCESILVQIRSEIMSDPNVRLDSNPDREYGEAEARDAFNRMVKRYGWN